MRKTFFRRNTDVFQGKMTRRTAKRPAVRVRWEFSDTPYAQTLCYLEYFKKIVAFLQILRLYSIYYADCRLSLLSAQKGKCSVSGELFLNPDNIVCHMKVPKEQGGHERYSNLVLLHRRYLPLLTDQDTAALKSMCKQLTVTKKQLTKINSLRTAAKLVAI